MKSKPHNPDQLDFFDDLFEDWEPTEEQEIYYYQQ